MTERRHGRRVQGSAAALAFAVFAAVAIGCGDSTDPTPTGPGQFAETCDGPEDCSTGLCIGITAASAICTTACSGPADCPPFENWSCVTPHEISTRVCACRPAPPNSSCGNGLDDDCDGEPDDCLICEGEEIAPDDASNCGRCGHACASDRECEAGSCVCSAEAATDCGGRCVDVDSDPDHCGNCSTHCDASQRCDAGDCVCASDAELLCPGAGCVRVSTDPEHCGECGRQCGTGQVCSDGACVCPTEAAPDHCPDAGCVDLATSDEHCGECDLACTGGETCVEGACECPVTAASRCDGRCTDLQSDPAHCGACGTACGPDLICSAGQCECPEETHAVCGEVCVDLSSNRSHCGGCDDACPAGEDCVDRSCTCVSGLRCSGTCVSVDDDANCGACGVECSSGQECRNGSCVCSTSGLQTCGSECVDTDTSTAHCGDCDSPCRATEICSGGTCTCPAGEQWCATPSACVDTQTDALHCGACDQPCPLDTQCSSAVCVCNDSALTFCDEQCVDLQSDPSHCSACGQACPGQMSCIDSECRCPNPIVGAEVQLTNSASETTFPVAAWNGTHLGVVYFEGDLDIGATTTDRGNAYFALLNPDGSRAVASDIALTSFDPSDWTAGAVSFPPDIVWTGSEFGVVWSQLTEPTPGVYERQMVFQRLDANGGLLGPLVVLASSGSSNDGETAFPAISWNPVYGGYAAVSTNAPAGYYRFTRIGADGTFSEPPLQIPLTSAGPAEPVNGRIEIDVSPAGRWGFIMDVWSDIHLVRVDPDGTEYGRPEEVNGIEFTDGGDVVHDGTDWVTAWAEGAIRPNGLWINRGWTNNDPYELIPYVSGSQRTYEWVQLANGPDTVVEIGWAHREVSQYVHNFQMQRFLPAADGTSAYRPITDVVDIVNTDAITLSGAVRLVHTGDDSLLALWAEERAGQLDLFAAPIDPQACP